VALLRRRHPVLKKAEGDWAASWFFRRRTKTHNRTLAQRRKKQKHPQRWAAKEAERKVKRFKKLHEELVEGDIETLEEALLQKALRDNEADPVDIDQSSDRGREESSSDSENGGKNDGDYRRFYSDENSPQRSLVNGWFPTLQPSARSHRPEQRKHVSARPKAPEMGRPFSNICLLKGLRRVSYVFSFASFFMFCTLSSCIVSSIVIYQRTPNITTR
jgi:hypothetical protein